MIGGSSHDNQGKRRRETKLERNFFERLKDALLLEFTIFLQHKSKRHLTAICGFKRQFCQQLPRSLLPPYSSLSAVVSDWTGCEIVDGVWLGEAPEHHK